MGFYFKFQKLLEIEKLKEEGLVKELKLLQKQLQDDEKMLTLLQSVFTMQQGEMEKELRKPQEANVFVLFEVYFAKLRRDMEAQGAKIKESAKKVALAREKLLVVFKRRKVLEKLRERQEKEYKEQMLRLENKNYDEIATSRFQFKKIFK
ncbi:MAG: flagellar export protein FliJ [Planctomycetota bacterium]|jgi:flagellar FliJ protein